MKKIKLLFAVTLLFGIGMLAACKKDTLITYSTFDNIYFNYAPSNNLTDSVSITFAYSPLSVTDSTFKIPIKITGPASSTDRVYNVKIDTGTTATDEQTKSVSLRLTLQTSDALHTDLKFMSPNVGASVNVNSFKVIMSDILVQGQYWSSYSPYFGTFSAKKIRLINQVTGMPLNYVTIVGLYDLSSGPRLGVWAVTMTNYLNQQKAAGHTVYEDDGVTPMAMAAAYQ
jgi:hypothetical protein